MTFQDDNRVVVSPRRRGGMEMRRARAPAEAFVGPLDGHTAGLQLALLPFRGFTSYLGPWARIREGAGSKETDIGYLADGAVDEAAYNSHVAGGDGFMRYWYDQSGADRSHGRATAIHHAQVAMNVVNGMPVARYNGTTNVSNNGVGGGPALASGSSAGGRTVYSVFKKRSPSAGITHRGAWSFSVTDTMSVDEAGSDGSVYWRRNAGGSAVNLGGDVTQWNLTTARHNPVASPDTSIWFNGGSATALDGLATFMSSTNFYLGSNAATFYGDVDIAAVLVYNAVHNDATRESITSILAGRFGL